jgi:hypothetical protein
MHDRNPELADDLGVDASCGFKVGVESDEALWLSEWKTSGDNRAQTLRTRE